MAFTTIYAIILLFSFCFNITQSLSVTTAVRILQRNKNSMALQSNTGVGYTDQKEYLAYLETISALPQGFSVGNSRFNFKPFEVQKTLPMNVTIIMADKPTSSFAAMFTSNQFPGGPIIIGKERMRSSEFLQAIVVNNKISNVCPGQSYCQNVFCILLLLIIVAISV